MYKTIVEAVLAYAEKDSDKLAVCFKEERLTYGNLAEYISSAAFILQNTFHITNGDKVMVSALSKPEFVVAMLGIQFLGATVIPIDKSLPEKSIEKMYNFVQPDLFLTDSRVNQNIVKRESLKKFYEDLKSQIRTNKMEYCLPPEDSIAEVIFTTGTTGEPKGAMLSYKNIFAGTINTRDGVGRNRDNVELIPLPLNHSFGLRVLRTLLYVGATAILQNGFMFIKETKTNLRSYECNGMCIVPASMEKLQKNLGEEFADIFGQLKYIEVGAGSLSVVSKQRTLELLKNTTLFNVWGSSETGGVIFLNVSKYPEHIASLGQVAEGVEMEFCRLDGKFASGDTVENAGKMILKGDMNMQGYMNMPEATDKAIQKGYLYTSDLAYKTKDGFIYMLGRVDDIINVGGEKVSPIEIENISCTYGNIQECACIRGIDKKGNYDEIPVLFVVPVHAEFNEREFLSFLSERVEQYKLPKEIMYIDKLPRNTMQTWKFTVITSKAEIASLKETIPLVAKRKGIYFYGFNNPDALILVSNDTRNQYGIQDSSCAIQNIMLSAHSLGIGSVWINALMKICNEPEIREKLNSYKIPANHNVWGMVALGYPANHPSPLAKRVDVVEWIE